jgi:hypothetical protein
MRLIALSRALAVSAMAGLIGVASLGLPSQCVGQLSEIRGRVMDRESGSAVREATVILEGPDTAVLVVTDNRGLFSFAEVSGGSYQVTVRHLAYGEYQEGVEVEADVVLALRIHISQQAIVLDPLVVEVISERELAARSRGTMIQEVTRAEIERAVRTSYHFGDILRQTVPGLQVRDSRSQPGARICVEFRGRRSIRFAGSCQTPVLILDGVRMHDPPSLYSTIQPETIQRIEVIPPAEAGLLYGSESANGVIVVETRIWREPDELEALPAHLRTGTYDWSLEVETHSWKKVFIASFIGTAIGVTAGLSLAENCVRFEELDRDLFASDCNSWATAGSWAAAVTFPLFGAALGSRYTGATPLSRGKFWSAVVSGSIALLPGYALASASQQDTSSPTFKGGQVMVFLGIPFAVTVADHLFRKFRGG